MLTQTLLLLTTTNMQNYLVLTTNFKHKTNISIVYYNY